MRRIRRALGGTFHEGGTTWAARAAAMLALLNLGNGRGGMALQICPSDDTRGLRRALGGAWYYTVTRGGSVVRDLPAKPNHPWEDLGDAFCYFAGGVAPSRDRDARPPQEVRYAIHGRIDPWTGKPREGSTQGSAQGGDRWPRR